MIYVVNANQREMVVAAGSTKGFQDGDTNKAKFLKPEGMCYGNGLLYICDALGHAIRVLDMKTKRVSTLGCRGETGDKVFADGAFGTAKLATPWSVCMDNTGKALIVADRGCGRIRRID